MIIILLGFGQIRKASVDMYTITNHTVVHSIKIPKDWDIVFFRH